MKRSGILLFGVLYVILSYGFSLASEVNCEIIHCEIVKQGKPVKIAWDRVTQFTNGKDIPPHYRKTDAVRYFLYISENKNEDERNAGSFTIKEIPIEPLIFKRPGHYYVGVRADIYNDSNIEQSKICWSDNRACTNNNPFVLKVEK